MISVNAARRCALALSMSLAIGLGLFSATARADGVEQLNAFLKTVQSARGSFDQQVNTSKGGKPQVSSGSFALQRPGRFRWSYEKPYVQLLVSDGKTLWSFDPELKQVVTKTLGKALSGSPAELLAGGEFDKNFKVSAGGVSEGIEFVDAMPRSENSGFVKVRVGMRGNLPVLMELHDSFGQMTVLRFTRFDPNPALGADTFRFVPPKGVDVIGD